MGTFDDIRRGTYTDEYSALPNANAANQNTDPTKGNTAGQATTTTTSTDNATGQADEKKSELLPTTTTTSTDSTTGKTDVKKSGPTYTVRRGEAKTGTDAAKEKDGATEEAKAPLTYEQMAVLSSPYTPPTKEELEAEKKKQKRDGIFAAIGDGISALSNIYFTSKGAPNAYTGKNTMSGANQARWDKLKKERQDNAYAYYSALARARQMDEQKANNERSWARQLGIDKLEEERYGAEKLHRTEQEAKAEEWRKKEYEQRDRQYRVQNELERAQGNRADKQIQNTYDVGMARAAATAQRAVRGKQIAFTDGEGKQFIIYENVWKGSMQQVFNAISDDWVALNKSDKNKYPFISHSLTAAQKEDFVKQNWSKSAKATAIMATLAQLDPAAMTSTEPETEEENFDQYKQQ